MKPEEEWDWGISAVNIYNPKARNQTGKMRLGPFKCKEALL